MPTEFLDAAARFRHRSGLGFWRRFAEIAPVVVAPVVTLFYLLLLGWICASLEAATGRPFWSDQSPGAYNPMEPSRRTADAPRWLLAWRAQP